jgi:hypothetical protein
MDLRYEGVERDRPLPAGSITVVPAGSSVLWRRQGSIDSLLIYLEPSLVARVAAESFEFDSTRTVVLPLDGLNAPELRSAMLARGCRIEGRRRCCSKPELKRSLRVLREQSLTCSREMNAAIWTTWNSTKKI